jgi:hypothetical protein
MPYMTQEFVAALPEMMMAIISFVKSLTDEI